MEKKSKEEENIEALSKKITIDEVTKICRKLKNRKAGGVDDIVNEIIKYGGINIIYVLWSLCERCRETEKTPAEWLKGNISIYLLDAPEAGRHNSSATSIALEEKLYVNQQSCVP